MFENLKGVKKPGWWQFWKRSLRQRIEDDRKDAFLYAIAEQGARNAVSQRSGPSVRELYEEMKAIHRRKEFVSRV